MVAVQLVNEGSAVELQIQFDLGGALSAKWPLKGEDDREALSIDEQSGDRIAILMNGTLNKSR